jgi:ParB family transcriptional regulator, chromosome partitioning protein
MPTNVLDIPVGEIIPDPNQPRQKIDPANIERLAKSIGARGILHPLRVKFDSERKCWRLLCGESRWRAAKLAGLATVPCIAVEGDVSEEMVLADQIVENVCRNDLPPISLAKALIKFKRLRGCNSQDLAAEMGISGSAVTRAEAMLTLPECVQAMVDDGRLSESAAYSLSRLKDEHSIIDLANTVVAKRLTRAEVIDACRKKGVTRKQGNPKRDRLAGKLEGISFSFSAGQALTVESMIKAVDSLRARLKELQKSEHKDGAALVDLLKAFDGSGAAR